MNGSNASNGWTQAHDDLLRELAASGVSKARIAIRLQRTENSIKHRAMTLGVKVASPPRLCSSDRIRTAIQQGGM